jgi:hypothetical protein
VEPHGKVDTFIEENVDFNNRQQFNINASVYVQDISQLTPVNSFVVLRQGGNSSFSSESFLYPLTADIKLTNDETVQTNTISQEFKHLVVSPGFTGGSTTWSMPRTP